MRARAAVWAVAAITATALMFASVSAATPAASITDSPPPPGVKWVGYYLPDAPRDTTPLDSVENQAGRHAAVSNFFIGAPAERFSATTMANAIDRGTVPLVTMEFWDYTKGTADQPAFALDKIAGGSYDEYLTRYAQDAAAFGKTIWLRPFHEMNGNWYPWGGTVNGNSAADLVAAWRHVKAVFHTAGADNVKFVWCPNADSCPSTSANAISAYWPGDSYVDYVAIDGYNAGASRGWRSFDSLFKASYTAVTALTAKPLFIAETASGPTGGDKAAWIRDMFVAIPARYPRITGVVWFDVAKERDWRIDSSSDCLSAFKSGAAEWARPHWSSTLSGSSSVSAQRNVTAYVRGTLGSAKGTTLVGRTVYLYRKSGTTWLAMTSRLTTTGGAYAFPVKWSSAGTRQYQVRFKGAVTSTDEYRAISKGCAVTVH